MPVLSIGAILVPIFGPEAAKIIKTNEKNKSLSFNFILLILNPINDLKSNQSNENILEADKIEYINESGKILATGSVLIIREGYRLEADKVSLDPSKNIIEAEGNIRINEGNGGIITASKIKISSNLNDGIIELPRIVNSMKQRGDL